jgi:WD40 repeat protein
VRLWDVAAGGACLKTLQEEGAPPVAAVRWAPNDRFLLSASLDGKAKIWDAHGQFKFAAKRTYAGHGGGVRVAKFAADGATFATASFAPTLVASAIAALTALTSLHATITTQSAAASSAARCSAASSRRRSSSSVDRALRPWHRRGAR